MRTCPDCAEDLDGDTSACPYCGYNQVAVTSDRRRPEICPDCAEPIPGEAEICPYCGYSPPLAASETTLVVAASAQSPAPQRAGTPAKERERSGALGGCLGVVVFVVVAAGIALRLAGGGDTDKRVPDVIGLSPDAAEQSLEDAGLGVDRSGGDILLTSNDIVCGQQPKAGAITSDDVLITVESNSACGREQDDSGGAEGGAVPPARRYAASVARDLKAENPEAQSASCTPDGGDLLSCRVVVGPTPSNPLSDNVFLRIRVGSDGNWEPIGPGP